MPRPAQLLPALLAALTLATVALAQDATGVFVRFQLMEPAATSYYVRLAGYIHVDPWYLPAAIIPEGADKKPVLRLPSGEFTPWFDLRQHAGKRLHTRVNRAGGLAEFPNVTADFITGLKSNDTKVVIELATEPDPKTVVRRFEETFRGTLTSFLVSPRLQADAAELETAAQMTDRRLAWAREASGGKRMSPSNLLVQTSLWGAQRPELNAKEGEVLWLLGFNVVGGQPAEIRERYAFRTPGHSWANFGPAVTRENAEAQMEKAGKRRPGAEGVDPYAPGVPFNFSDEITAPAIGTNAAGLASFRAWLKTHGARAKDLGVRDLAEVVPIESPTALRTRQEQGRATANRVFYFSSRFRQESAIEKFRWLTEAFRRHVSTNALTSTLPADHPYFSGTGFGMGMGPNPAWGSTPLAADWFDLARSHALDTIGIEDWMGLQYMYGPGYTWEGFQLMGFQAAIMRSGSRGEMPVIAWITPSDGTNICLKSASALCQGAKHFFYWSYGPTATCTENYWSDLRGAYDGVVTMSRQLAKAEHILAPGRMRPTRVALLYSISSDLWQPFGYVHMLERRQLYLALVHEQYLVDMLTEEDVLAGRLKDYAALYTADPCIRADAMDAISDWVAGGGRLLGTCAAGSRNEFDEPVSGLAKAFGIRPEIVTTNVPGAYHIRAGLNPIAYIDAVTPADPAADPAPSFGVVGTQVSFTPKGAQVIATFSNGAPAVVVNRYRKGTATYVGGCPGLSYAKDAKFVPRELKEQWPAAQRAFITATARAAGAPKVVELSHPVVEAGVYDAPGGTALVLGNFTYTPIADLKVKLAVSRAPARVTSAERGSLKFTTSSAPVGSPAACPIEVQFALPLGLNDIVLVEQLP